MLRLAHLRRCGGFRRGVPEQLKSEKQQYALNVAAPGFLLVLQMMRGIRQCSLSRANDADTSDTSRAGRMRKRRGSGRRHTTWMASLILAQDKRWRRA